VKNKHSVATMDAYSDGGQAGPISGPGGPTEDAIPMEADDGSYVLNAEAVKMKGTKFLKSQVKQAEEAMAEDGIVPDGEAEDVPIKVSDGEWYFSKDHVRYIGRETLDKWNEAGLAKREGGGNVAQDPNELKRGGEISPVDNAVQEQTISSKNPPRAPVKKEEYFQEGAADITSKNKDVAASSLNNTVGREGYADGDLVEDVPEEEQAFWDVITNMFDSDMNEFLKTHPDSSFSRMMDDLNKYSIETNKKKQATDKVEKFLMDPEPQAEGGAVSDEPTHLVNEGIKDGAF